MMSCKTCKVLEEQNAYLRQLIDKILESHGLTPVQKDERIGAEIEKDIIKSEQTGYTKEEFGD